MRLVDRVALAVLSPALTRAAHWAAELAQEQERGEYLIGKEASDRCLDETTRWPGPIITEYRACCRRVMMREGALR